MGAETDPIPCPSHMNGGRMNAEAEDLKRITYAQLGNMEQKEESLISQALSQYLSKK